ncbi:SPOSA6832_00260 [Sporobolomyces salmonicolor]|uniref:Golgi apparatus membrane protein TVP23 n=1 Tax=Sporidiobolus salmonicolor TaxID=5005 RepID=A0A0D6EFL7_SPOSA|nr:SPOSA6832_00260 [Sporobolomyces salmonicolor]
MAFNPHSSSSNLLLNLEGQISADDDVNAEEGRASTRSPLPPSSNQYLQPPAARGSIPTSGSGSQDAEQSIWKESAHPVALFFLFFFRCAAIATYLLCGFFSSSYVFSVITQFYFMRFRRGTVLVVVLLSLDFWTVRNVSGRVLVGLRFWNQVDEDGTSFWVFESRGPDQPANAVDSKMFWIAMYSVRLVLFRHLASKRKLVTYGLFMRPQFPAAWVLLLFVGILKFNVSFLPIVMLALVFNVTNTVGYTYGSAARQKGDDRDAKRRWATGMAASGMLGSMGGLGGSIVSGIASTAYSRIFG